MSYLCEPCDKSFPSKRALVFHQRKGTCVKTVSSESVASPKKAISLFSGAGGDTLGLERAGYEVVAFSEWKKPAIQTHLQAFPSSVQLVHPETGSTNITELPDEVLMRYTGNVDVIFAGFPCQGFSHAGKKRADDPRNELVHEFVRAVRIIQPRWFIGENVPGLLSRTGRDPVTKEQRPVMEIIQDLFAAIGYSIAYRVWKAVEHGVAQDRKRLLLVGVPASHGWPVLPALPAKGVLPTIRSYLETHLEGAVEWNTDHTPHGLSPHYWIRTTDTKPSGTPHPNLLRLLHGIRNRSTKERLSDPSEEKTIHVPGGLISFGVRKSSYHGQVVDPDLPSKTIICTYGVCPRLFVGLYNESLDRYWVRCLSVRELGQIQGFPADYPWCGTEKEKITQIGNAVPPPLAEAVARSLEDVTYTQERPHTTVKDEMDEKKEDEDEDEDEE